MGKKKLNQDDLNSMKPEDVFAIDPKQIPEGFNVVHENGNNPQLIEAKGSIKQELIEKRDTRTIEDNKGVLFLRFFKKDETNGKILTRFKRKVYFPIDSKIEPGWYVATIVEERDNHGVMDTMKLESIDPTLWNPKYIKGVYVKRNHALNQLEIYPAIPKEFLEEQQPTCIFTVKLQESDKKSSGMTIGDVIDAKKKQALMELHNHQ